LPIIANFPGKKKWLTIIISEESTTKLLNHQCWTRYLQPIQCLEMERMPAYHNKLGNTPKSGHIRIIYDQVKCIKLTDIYQLISKFNLFAGKKKVTNLE
jgi:hypothetical protein